MTRLAEMFTTARGLLAYGVCFYTPLRHVSWRLYSALLPYAGDWGYRKERRAFRKAGTA